MTVAKTVCLVILELRLTLFVLFIIVYVSVAFTDYVKARQFCRWAYRLRNCYHFTYKGREYKIQIKASAPTRFVTLYECYVDESLVARAAEISHIGWPNSYEMQTELYYMEHEVYKLIKLAHQDSVRNYYKDNDEAI